MASMNDLRDVIVTNLDKLKREKELAEEMQADFDSKVEWLEETLTTILAPLITDKFGELPLVGIRLDSDSTSVHSVAGRTINLPGLIISIGIKSIRFHPSYDADGKELQYSANLRAGTFCTNTMHVWVIRRDDSYGLIAENVLSEFLIQAVEEAS
jgi:hypothetical protein